LKGPARCPISETRHAPLAPASWHHLDFSSCFPSSGSSRLTAQFLIVLSARRCLVLHPSRIALLLSPRVRLAIQISLRQAPTALLASIVYMDRHNLLYIPPPTLNTSYSCYANYWVWGIRTFHGIGYCISFLCTHPICCIIRRSSSKRCIGIGSRLQGRNKRQTYYNSPITSLCE
jgi:hypothetical protein